MTTNEKKQNSIDDFRSNSLSYSLLRICYFGNYDAGVGRNKVYISGLRKLGHTVIECRDTSGGFLKYIRLWQKHRKLRHQYDAFIVGCPGHAVVWLAKLISKKPVIFDAGWTMEEAVIFSRGQRGFLGLNHLYIRCIDWLAVACADVVLVETEAQRNFFAKKFGESTKYAVVYTGADDEFFFTDKSSKKNETFTAVFRGKFLPEAGVQHVVTAAKILEQDQINVLIIGNGFLEKEIKKMIEDIHPSNLTLISEYLSFSELRTHMLSAHVSLGQLEDHERLLRTIPHKCFETIAMGIAYITARSAPVSEILKDEESVLFVNHADPQDLADKILMLKNNSMLAEKIAHNGHEVYQKRCTPVALAQNIVSIIKNFS